MIKKIKKLFWKHWNCLPWLVCGIAIMSSGEISVFQYFLCWLAVMWFIWKFLELEQDIKEREDKGE